MTLYILFALSLVALWLYLTRRAYKVVMERIDMAVLAIGQTVTADLLRTQRQLTPEQKREVLDKVLKVAEQLIAPWNLLLLRISLLRRDVTPWLTIAIESRVRRLKSRRALPISRSATLARDPHMAKLNAIAAEWLNLLKTYAPVVSPRERLFVPDPN